MRCIIISPIRCRYHMDTTFLEYKKDTQLSGYVLVSGYVRILSYSTHCSYLQRIRTGYAHKIHSHRHTLIVAHIYLLQYWRTFRYVHGIRSHRHSLTRTFIVATPFGSGIAGIRAHDTCTGYARYAHRIRRIRDAATL